MPSDPAREVWLLRHAETEWSVSGQHTGRSDIPLTDAGRDRAREVGLRVAEVGFKRVLCSPLGRARETAELAGLVSGRLSLDDDLLEWDYGEYEGITTAEIRQSRPDWYLWRDGSPGGESPEQVGTRVDRVIAEARASHGPVALVAHGHILRALAARWIGLPVAVGGSLGLSTGTVSVLGFEREVPVIWRWNEGD